MGGLQQILLHVLVDCLKTQIVLKFENNRIVCLGLLQQLYQVCCQTHCCTTDDPMLHGSNIDFCFLGNLSVGRYYAESPSNVGHSSDWNGPLGGPPMRGGLLAVDRDHRLQEQHDLRIHTDIRRDRFVLFCWLVRFMSSHLFNRSSSSLLASVIPTSLDKRETLGFRVNIGRMAASRQQWR